VIEPSARKGKAMRKLWMHLVGLLTVLLLAGSSVVAAAQESDTHLDPSSGELVYGDPADRFTLPLVGGWTVTRAEDGSYGHLTLDNPTVDLYAVSLGPDEATESDAVLARIGIDAQSLLLVEETTDAKEFPGWRVILYAREDGMLVGVLSRELDDGSVTLVGIGDLGSIVSAETVLTVRRFSDLPVAEYLARSENRLVTAPTSVAGIDDLDNIEFHSGGTKLMGRLRLPDGEGPFPAVVGTHGSGRGTRWAGEFVPVTHLVDAGFAVFNYDKRGVDDSGGHFVEVGAETGGWRLPELADDALAAVAFLQGLEGIDPGRVGLMGGSQAGWVNALAASRTGDLAFIVSVVGPTVTVGEEIYYSDLTGGGPRLPREMGDEQRQSIADKLAAYDGIRGFDPRPAIEAMTIPGLWILGGRDASIPTPESRAILEEITAEYDKDITVVTHPEQGHDIGHSVYQDEVVEWLGAQLGSRGSS